MALPRFAVIQSMNLPENYLRYTSEDGELHGVLQVTGEEIVSPYSKFEIVRPSSTTASHGFFNIRCCYNNKYWVAQSSSYNTFDYIIVAGADEANEDQSELSCTLFELVLTTTSGKNKLDEANTIVRFRHAQLGKYLSFGPCSSHDRALFAHSSSPTHDERDVFGIIDWQSLVILPKHIAFKGDNGKYLQYSGNHLLFSSSDIGNPYVGNELFITKDGKVRIKNNYSGQFWRGNNNTSECCIWFEPTTEDRYMLFSPVKIGANVIGLRLLGNNRFCQRQVGGGNSDLLNADITTLSAQAHLVVEELAIARQIYNVKFHLLDARIYKQKVVSMVTKTVINNTREPENVTIHLTHKETRSSTWNSSMSLTVGVKTTMEVGIPLVADVSVEISTEFTGAYAWGETVTKETEVSSEHKTTVPPMTKVTVSLLATQASCDVPFSYTQRDTLTNGKHVISNHDDGLYTGINSFNFRYETKEENLQLDNDGLNQKSLPFRVW